MSNLPGLPIWEEFIKEVGIGEAVSGGPDGTVNLPLLQLTNRTEWLKRLILNSSGLKVINIDVNSPITNINLENNNFVWVIINCHNTDTEISINSPNQNCFLILTLYNVGNKNITFPNSFDFCSTIQSGTYDKLNLNCITIDGGLHWDIRDLDAICNGGGSGGTPNESFSVSPLSIIFPDVNVNQETNEKIVTISNTGNQILDINSISLNNGTNFNIKQNLCGNNLLVGHSCNVKLTFKPTSIGSKSDTLQISTNYGNRNVSLSGECISPANLLVFPTSLNFPPTNINEYSTHQNITLQNNGQSDLIFSDISIASSDFEITSNSCSNFPLSPGNVCQVAVKFHPHSPGQINGNLNIESNGGNFTINLEGEGVADYDISVIPNSLNFSQTVIGNTTNEQFVTIRNNGNALLTFYGISLTNSADFEISSNTCGNNLNVGGTCQIGLKFHPQSVGNRTSDLNIFSDGGNAVSNLWGEGVTPSELVRTPAVINFPDTPVSSESSKQTLTLKNIGNVQPITINSITISNNVDFKISENLCTNILGPNDSCEIKFIFNPQSTGVKSCTVNINSSAGNLEANLNGKGIQADLNRNPDYLEFEKTEVGHASSTQIIQITNTGTAPLTFNSFNIDISDFTIVSNSCGNNLANGSTCAVEISFTPQSIGIKNGIFEIDSDVGNLNTNLKGEGITPGQIQSDKSNIEFEDTLNNHISSPEIVNIQNVGGANVLIEDVDIVTGENNFDIYDLDANIINSELAPGSSFQIKLTFSPSMPSNTIGIQNGTLEIKTSRNNLLIPLSGNIPNGPVLTTDKNSLNFPDTRKNSTSDYQQIQISNTGDYKLSISGLEITGSNPTEFHSVSSNFKNVLQPNETCDILINFAPTSIGNKTAIFRITSDGGNIDIDLSGVGLPEGGKLKTNYNSITFPDTIIDTTSSEINLILENEGDDLLTFSSVENINDSNNNFTINITELSNLGYTLNPNQTSTLHCFFTPTETGNLNSILRLVHDGINAIGGKTEIPLNGKGLFRGPLLYTDKDSINFPDVIKNNESDSITLLIRNDGDTDLTFSFADIDNDPGNNFRQESSDYRITLHAGEHCSFDIYFKPTTSGFFTAIFKIESDGGNKDIQLSGRGLNGPELQISENTINFPSTYVNETSPSHSLELTNIGDSDLTITTQDIINNNPANFYAIPVGGLKTVLTPNETYEYDVYFNPQLDGNLSAVFRIESDGGNEDINLHGNGLPLNYLFSWGKNTYGEVGDGTTNQPNYKKQIGSHHWKDILAMDEKSFAIREDGTLWAWGFNLLGILGLNDTTNYSSPVQVGSDNDWDKLAYVVEASHVGALKTNKQLYLWGKNNYGQLGIGNTTDTSSPVQVGGTIQWNKVSMGWNFTIAIRSDGTLWAWGKNNYGQLGLNDTSHRSLPTQIGTESDWIDIKCGNDFAIGMRSSNNNSTIWTWGNNNRGQLGNYTPVSEKLSSPTQIGSETNWQEIAAGSKSGFAIKNDGTLWSWGENYDGQLGLITSGDYRNRACNVGGNNWIEIYPSEHATFGLRSDGLFAWGANNDPNVGDINIFGDINISSTSSPVQVHNDKNWKMLDAGSMNILGIINY